MTGVNKLFYAACAAWALGRKVDVRVMGDAREMKALSEALRTTNELREEITRDGATVESMNFRRSVESTGPSKIARHAYFETERDHAWRIKKTTPKD